MRAALKNAGVAPSEVQYVNAHGTSTPLGDDLELERGGAALGRRRGKVAMSSTKSAIGHLLGAAGAVEGMFSILAIRDKRRAADPESRRPRGRARSTACAKVAQERPIEVALSNSFGFGGTNASIVFRAAA